MLNSNVVIPYRYSTRAARPDDSPLEFSHLSPALFEAGVKSGSLYPHWTRKLDIHHKERYAFDSPTEGDERTRVLAVNSGFLEDQGKTVQEVRANGLIVALRAEKAVREQRLKERSKVCQPRND